MGELRRPSWVPAVGGEGQEAKAFAKVSATGRRSTFDWGEEKSTLYRREVPNLGGVQTTTVGILSSDRQSRN